MFHGENILLYSLYRTISSTFMCHAMLYYCRYRLFRTYLSHVQKMSREKSYQSFRPSRRSWKIQHFNFHTLFHSVRCTFACYSPQHVNNFKIKFCTHKTLKIQRKNVRAVIMCAFTYVCMCMCQCRSSLQF